MTQHQSSGEHSRMAQAPAHAHAHEHAHAEPRTSESPLAMPSLGRVALLLGRALRLRCPNCGLSPVLEAWRPGRKWGAVRQRCASCTFRYERSDDHYFSGALFTNLFMSEALFAFAFATAVILMWPDVPWDSMTYVAGAGAVIAPTLLYPVSKVVWLTVDVLVRPVTASEVDSV